MKNIKIHYIISTEILGEKLNYICFDKWDKYKEPLKFISFKEAKEMAKKCLDDELNIDKIIIKEVTEIYEYVDGVEEFMNEKINISLTVTR